MYGCKAGCPLWLLVLGSLLQPVQGVELVHCRQLQNSLRKGLQRCWWHCQQYGLLGDDACSSAGAQRQCQLLCSVHQKTDRSTVPSVPTMCEQMQQQQQPK
jgi:hypothetical protein